MLGANKWLSRQYICHASLTSTWDLESECQERTGSHRYPLTQMHCGLWVLALTHVQHTERYLKYQCQRLLLDRKQVLWSPARPSWQWSLWEVTFLKLFLQLFDFFLKLAEQSILWVLIDSRFVFNVLGAVGIPQGADSFIIIIICWPNICTLLN